MKKTKLWTCWVAVVTVAWICPAASGGSVVPLAGNPDALVSGTEAFSNGPLSADIDYAVFAPGVFTDTLGGNFDMPALGGFDPVTDFVYAYQIENSGTDTISSLQLTLEPGGLFTDLGQDPLADPAGLPPAVITPIGASAASYIFLPNIDATISSSVLLLSSPQSAGFGRASVIDGGRGAEGLLPVPIFVVVPEPATGLLGLSLLIVLGAGCRRQSTFLGSLGDLGRLDQQAT